VWPPAQHLVCLPPSHPSVFWCTSPADRRTTPPGRLSDAKQPLHVDLLQGQILHSLFFRPPVLRRLFAAHLFLPFLFNTPMFVFGQDVFFGMAPFELGCPLGHFPLYTMCPTESVLPRLAPDPCSRDNAISPPPSAPSPKLSIRLFLGFLQPGINRGFTPLLSGPVLLFPFRLTARLVFSPRWAVRPCGLFSEIRRTLAPSFRLLICGFQPCQARSV